jgi:transposase InsO family protein
MEAKTVAKPLVEEVIVRFGTPYVIHTDQGVHFESNLFQEMCRLLPPLVTGNSQRMSIAMHSIGNPVSIICIMWRLLL